MKKYAKYMGVVWLFLSGLNLSAQEVDSAKTKNYKFYIGVGLPLTMYYLFYDHPKNPSLLQHASFVPKSLHLGYRLNKRVIMEGGIAYGGSGYHYKFPPSKLISGEMAEDEDKSRTHVIALLLTSKLILINANKSLPIYVTASVMPAYGTTRYYRKRTVNNETSTEFDVQDEGMDVFAMAGFGFNYRIWRRFSGKADFLLFRRNLTGRTFDHYWGQGWGEKALRSLSIGFNYDLGKKS
ncbi:outer membrane beta-barrel protein [Rufibacter roseolus]|uniref:outer membrane beta-barrel protein n=1 Tax=Rufibacter roseolus TaxID=2817375 RepID=UPI001B318856|nr:outer membrane beta-barrel protein [Rufibacter roseolus]